MISSSQELQLASLRRDIIENLAQWRENLQKPILNSHATISALHDALQDHSYKLLLQYIDFLGFEPGETTRISTKCFPYDSHACNEALVAQIITHPGDRDAFVTMHNAHSDLFKGAVLDFRKTEVLQSADPITSMSYAMATTMSREECSKRISAAMPIVSQAHDLLDDVASPIPAQNRESIAASIPPEISLEELMSKHKSRPWDGIVFRVRNLFR